MKLFIILLSFFMILGGILCSGEEENKDTKNCADTYTQIWYDHRFNETSELYMKPAAECQQAMKEQPVEREKALKLGYAFLPLFKSGNSQNEKCYLLNDEETMNTALSTIRKSCGKKAGAVMAQHLNQARKCFQCDMASQTPIIYH